MLQSTRSCLRPVPKESPEPVPKDSPEPVPKDNPEPVNNCLQVHIESRKDRTQQKQPHIAQHSKKSLQLATKNNPLPPKHKYCQPWPFRLIRAVIPVIAATQTGGESDHEISCQEEGIRRGQHLSGAGLNMGRVGAVTCG